MSVYVDALIDYSALAKVNGKGWRYGKSCHLIADSVQELKEFAARLGLKPEWFQPQSSPHFDLTASKRAIAVRLGAIELDRKAFVAKIMELRQRRNAGEPV